MSKLRKLLIFILAVCMAVCLAIGLAACGEDGPDVINPDKDINTGEFSGDYVITMQSLGRMGLRGIEIDVKKDGEIQFSGTSLENGQIAFHLTPDVYNIEIKQSTIPKGYSLADPNRTYVTKIDEPEVHISFESSVITSSDSPSSDKNLAPYNTNYAKGDVMYDFSFSAVRQDGDITYSLSETLKTKSAVVLNFWGTQCNPCVTEFPALQTAYEKYSDKLEIFALSSYMTSDNRQVILDFKGTRYTFPMGLDYGAGTPNLYTMFNVSAYPTTVIIDRYGVVAYRLTGSNPNSASWESLFTKYTSDNYSQDIDVGGDDDGEIVYEECPPEIQAQAPDSAAIVQAITTQSSQDKVSNFQFSDDSLSWPWLVDSNGSYLYASNSSAGSSYAVLNFTISLAPLQGIEFKYKANTLSNNNILFLIMDGRVYWFFSGSTSDDWQTVKINSLNETDYYYSRSSHDLNVTLLYEKDDEVAGDAYFMIDDIRLFNVAEELGLNEDYALSIVDGQDLTNGKYTGLDGKIVERDDNLLYYVYTNENGQPEESLLIADILDITSWTDLHIGSYYVDVADEDGAYTVVASLYNITWYHLTEYGENMNGNYDRVIYDDAYKIFLTYTLQGFSDNGLVPVTPALRDALIEFTKAVYGVDGYTGISGLTTDTWYEDQWLELCFFFRHYGNDETHDGRGCYRDYNPVDGLAYDYAQTFTVSADEEGYNLSVNITKPINYTSPAHAGEAGGGKKYWFTVERDGLYAFSSYDASIDSDPQVSIYDPATNRIIERFDDDTRIDNLVVDGQYNLGFYGLARLQANHTYGVAFQMYDPQLVGEYSVNIKYVGESAEMTVACTTGGGMWEFVYDSNGNVIDEIYLAVDAGLSGGAYHVMDRGEYGALIYIDFVHYNYSEYVDPLITLIERGLFDNVNVNGTNVAEYLRGLYNASIAVDESDWRYGLTVATEELVEILSAAMGESVASKAWEQFAVYRQKVNV